MDGYEDVRKSLLGKKALVMGNGPSLDNLNFDLIKKDNNIITFSTNQIADICRRENWFPDIYASFFCGPLRGKRYSFPDGTSTNYNGSYEKALEAQEDIRYVVENERTTCFVHEWYQKFITPRKNINFIKPVLWNRHTDFPENGFEIFRVPNNFLWHNATTPLFQLCFFLGFKQIAVIGQDGYVQNRENHFLNYRGNELSTDAHIERANRSISLLHNAVKNYSDKNQIEVCNLSDISILKQYERTSLKDFLER